MRSINIKKAAAVVAGAAMVAGAISPVLAAVQPDQDTVNSLINDIKNNLTDTQVVIGAESQAIDSVQGAKIAAVLATLNYQPTTIEPTEPTVTVNVEGTVVNPTDNTRYMETAASTGTDSYRASPGSALTITKENMKDVLKQRTLEISDNSSGSMASHTYYYEDKIYLDNSKLTAQYSEDPAGNTGHGLYLKVDASAIKYKISFGGTGIPVGSTVEYQTTPELEILGNTYGLDYENTASGTLAFYTGTKTMINTGDTITTDDGVQVEFMSGTGTDTAKGYFKIIGKDGSTIETGELGATESYTTTIDGVKVTLKVESIGYNAADSSYTAQIRVGTGTQKYESGDLFPGQTDWVVDGVTVSSSNKLTEISLKYNGNYLGTYQNGLAKGAVINGPLTADGTPLFTVDLEGYGSTSTEYHTTDLTFKGMGQASTSTELIQAQWYSRDNVLQKFEPEYPTQANFTVANLSGVGGWSDGNGTILNSQDSNGYISKWTIINDKVVYLEDVSKNTDDNTYTVKFRIADKDNGDVVEYSGLSNATDTTFTYTTTNNPISCTFRVVDYVGSTANRRFVELKNGSDCDLTPDAVPFGYSVDMTNNPTMDFTHAIEGSSDPYITISENSETLKVKYNDTTGLANKQSGMIGYVGATTVIDQTSTTTYTYDSNMYQETGKSAIMDGSEVGKVSITVPSASRHALIKIAGASATSGLGEQTLKVGDKVNGVTIEKINVDTISGTYYKQVASGLQPQDLVVLDTENPTATYKIVVGGYYVNKLAAAMTCGHDLQAAGDNVICAEGNNLLVAGYEGTDTATATNELISLLTA